jgi:peptidoglycan/LPS O-acetylase OafA/YrhL
MVRTIGKIQSIEGLRGILALWVVLSHTLAAAGLGTHWRGPFAVLAVGGNAVDVFIIVSGFVIFYLLDTAHEGYVRFIWRRALRLYPVYLVCLLASLLVLPAAVQAFAAAPWPHPLNASRVQIAHNTMAFLPQQIAAHLAMVHSLIPDSLLPNANYAILGQAWSLSLEWQFYVLAPRSASPVTSCGGRRIARAGAGSSRSASHSPIS